MPRTEVFEAGGSWFYVLHNLNDLDLDPTAGGFDVVVSGHSRSPRLERRNGCLYVNPGSAGPRRFKLPVAVARLHLNATGFEGELVELEI
jgi:predicted phosphodiesterase